CQQNSDWRRTF
nr:immunoglobulin light chain junction region [Macaca mulatta]